MAVNDFFIWGQSGTKKTPDQIAREREIADAILMRAGNTAPVGHWTQGAARVLDALGGVVKERRAAAGENEIASVNKGLIESLLGGSSSAPSATPVSSSAIPMTSAAGEVAATAPGSASVSPSGVLPASFLGAVDTTEGGGGYDTLYGHAQRGKFSGTDVSAMPIRDVIAFTDPRGPYAQTVKSQIGRVATPVGRHQIVGTTLRNAVADLGLDPNAKFDAATQDRIALHLAKNRVASADTMGGKISALRSEWHGFKGVPDEQMRQIVADIEQSPLQVASLAPQTATDAIEAVAPLQPTPEAGSMSYAGQEAAPPVSLSDEVAAYQQTPEYASAFPGRAVQPAQASAAAPVQMAGGGDRVPMASSGINQAIVQALTNPQATPQTQRLAAILMEQEQRRAMAQEEQRLQAADPMRQIEMERAQLELEQSRQPKQQQLINAGDGRLYDPNTSQWLQAPGGGSDQFRAATQEEAQRMGAAAGQFGPDGRFYPLNPPQGTSLSVDPTTGAVTFNQGAGVKPLTEAQSKDTVFATRATNSLPLVDRYEQSLLSLGNNLAEGIPLNLGNYAQSEEYQVARDAGRDFLATILRKDSGAAITSNEEQIYGRMFLPQPGDKPAAIQAKRQRRALAVEAIKAGMPAAAIENMAKALETVPSSTDIEIQTDIPGVKIRRKN